MDRQDPYQRQVVNYHPMVTCDLASVLVVTDSDRLDLLRRVVW